MPAVLVVGAGPTGLLLAAELQRRGVDCRLVDARPAPLHWDRATIVHPRSLEVFEALGLVDRFLAAGVKQRFARIHSAGRVLGDIDLSICGSRYGFNVGISEEVTETILTDYLHALGGDVVRGSRLVGLEERAGGLRATLSSETLDVEWVVGCDGVHSTARELSGITLAGTDIVEPWAVFDVTLGGWSETYEGIFGYLDETPVILTSLPEQRWRVYLRPTSADSDLVADATATLARYHPALTFDAVTNPTRFHCHDEVATHFRAGRVLLAGDAAHVCSPAQGHGMNSGLQDAYNLAWKLALVCRGEADPALLDSYEAERRPVALAITASGDAVEHAQGLRDPAERRARDEALRTTFADPTSRHHEAIAEAELDIDYRDSPIVMGDLSAILAPGQRLPDVIAVLLPNGERRGLHELTHRTGHTALIVGGPSAEHDALARLSDAIAADASILVEATCVLTTSAARTDWLRLDVADATALGIDDVALLVVRPDGHVGLRADRDHFGALASYRALVASVRIAR